MRLSWGRKKLLVRTSFAQCSLLDSLDTTNQTSACEYFFNGWKRATRVTFQLENIFAALSCIQPCYYRMLSLRNVRIESYAVGNSRCFDFYPYERNSFDWLACKTAIAALDVFRGFLVKMEKILSSSRWKCLEFPVQSLLTAPPQLFKTESLSISPIKIEGDSKNHSISKLHLIVHMTIIHICGQ